jgi:glyoxylase-like metal-dependent hydrolase (beta-lactamase superfamily II)
MQHILFNTGIYDVNTYVIYAKNEAFILDPGGLSKKMEAFIVQKNLVIKGIILSHGHGDHIGGAKYYSEIYKCNILAYKKEKDILLNPDYNYSSKMEMENVSIDKFEEIKDGQLLTLDGEILKVIHTPGHTHGSIVILTEDRMYCGDTLFKGSVGRWDLYSGNENVLLETLKNKFKDISDDIHLFPGHGGSTTLGKERRENPFEIR